MDTTINNATALLEECLHNGDKGLVALQGWFLGERHLIKTTIAELNESLLQQAIENGRVGSRNGEDYYRDEDGSVSYR